MLLAAFIVEQNPLLDGFLNGRFGKGIDSGLLRERGGNFQDVVGAAGVSARVGGDFAKSFVGGFEMQRTQTALGVAECAAQKKNNLIFGQRLQQINAAAREQRGVDFEGRIFGGGADQADAAFLDV